jgi:hypothetical protein
VKQSRSRVNASVTYADSSNRRFQPEALTQLKLDFDRRLAALNEWLDQTESTLELITSDIGNSNDNLTVEEQLVLIEVRHFSLHRIIFEPFRFSFFITCLLRYLLLLLLLLVSLLCSSHVSRCCCCCQR